MTLTETERGRVRRLVELYAEAGASSSTVEAGELDAATALAVDLYEAAARHGYNIDDLAAVSSVPAAAWDLVRIIGRRRRQNLPK